MLPPCLHATGWHGPDPALKIDLAPACSQDLAAAGGGEDKELQSPGCRRISLPQHLYKSGHLLIRHRWVVSPLQLVPLRQRVLQVALPSGWVFSLAQPLGLGSIENRFDAASQSRGGLVLCRPDGLENCQHFLACDLIDRFVPDRSRIG
jgi:hypothetical protein